MPNMQYRVMVSDRAGHDLETTLTHGAPAWLFDPSVDNTSAYLKVLEGQFHDDILRKTPWHV